ncbi:MAG: phosphatidylglycerol lysyltransferase [Treponema sp.]|jgi:phosphoglucomutase|nr:phosphatidylglycerol lysyltransferase [Treponema sp.]
MNAEDRGLLRETLEAMILSASGWRGVFTADGGGESRTGEISAAHRLIAAGAGMVFAAYLRGDAVPACGGSAADQGPLVLVGRDTRPTGEAVAGVLISALLASGCTVRYGGITAAPEIMAWARNAGEGAPEIPCGFVYISASHNPIGYNGLKFGLADGGVLPGPEAAKLTEAFRVLMESSEGPGRVEALLASAPSPAPVFGASPAAKDAATDAYLRFTSEVVYGEGGDDLAAALKAGLKERKLGIAADFNGSARTLSIDRNFFASLGLDFHIINGVPGEIVHPIIPEGESLEPCRRFLEECHAADPSVILAYVPDCDGDRGNLVIHDEGEGRARALEAQEVFALSCVAELAQLVWTGELRYDSRGNALSKTAVVVNDSTSMRIDRIAAAFDVPVFRAEVGEANVVGLARNLREKGCTVRILGEGSNGGTIIHPSAVRDPVDTVTALVKLLALRSNPEKKGLFEIWCALSDQGEIYRDNFTLADIITSLPAWVTTAVVSPGALLEVRTADHALLKRRYQKIFLREWETRKGQLGALTSGRRRISRWEVSACNGTTERRGLTDFGEAGRGGLKIYFLNDAGDRVASIWMRGSATEPVFRIMADVEGQDKRIEQYLIEWQRRMIAEADLY